MDFLPVMAVEVNGSLDSLKTVFSWLLTGIGDVVSTIAATPLLLLPVGLFAVGGTIGLAKRFIGR